MFCEKKTKRSELCLGENLWFLVKCFVFKILSSWAAGVDLGRIFRWKFVGEYIADMECLDWGVTLLCTLRIMGSQN